MMGYQLRKVNRLFYQCLELFGTLAIVACADQRLFRHLAHLEPINCASPGAGWFGSSHDMSHTAYQFFDQQMLASVH